MHEHINRRILIPLSIAASFFRPVSLTADEPVALRPKYPTGRVRYVEIVEETEQVIKSPRVPGGETKMRINNTKGVLEKVESSSEAGVELSLTFDRAASVWDVAMMGGQLRYDTDAPSADDNPYLRQIFEPMLGQSLHVKLGRDRKVESLTGMADVKNAIRKKAAANPIFMQMRENLTDDMARQRWGDVRAMVLPTGKVRVGDIWTGRIEEKIPQVGEVVLSFECKLESILDVDGDRSAVISYTGTTGSKDPQGAQDKKGEEGAAGDEASDKPEKPVNRVEGTFQGKAIYDIQRGEIVRQEEESQTQLAAQTLMGHVDVAMKRKKTTTTTRLAVREAEKKERRRKAEAEKAAAEKARREKAGKPKAGTGGESSPEKKPTAKNPLQSGTPWTRWGGPHGNFKTDVEGLADAWPVTGPPGLWKRELGDGYSAIVCDSERLYTMYRIDDEEKKLHQEVVVALDPVSGRTVWEHRYDAPFEKDMSMEYGPGPNSTPLVVGDRLFTVGVTVKFHCLDKKTGRVHWVRDLREAYGASHMSRGYGASPYAYQDWIILPIGGEGQAVMAFRQKDGEVAWKNQDFPSTFATPFVSRVGGESQLIVFVDKAVAGLDPSNGELKWRHEHPTQFGANISTPVLSKDGCIFIASAYNMGSRGIRLVRHDGRTVPEEMWYNRKMQIHFGNAIRIGDHVYGSSAFMGPAFFACVDMKTGEFAWKERGIGKASCVYGDGKMIILAEDGNLFLTSVGPERIRIHSKFQACESNAWTVPTLVGRTLFVRDRKSIMALDLG